MTDDLVTSVSPLHLRSLDSEAERDDRWQRISAAMREQGYDVLLFASADYRGHKGSVRYLSGYNPAHRHAYAVMHEGEEPIVVLPQNLESDRRPASGWVSEYRTPHNLGAGLVAALSEKGDSPHIGVIGLRQVMKVEDYLAVVQGLPNARISDADPMFNRIRAVKSPAEQLAVQESAEILDACFDRLLEIACPGLTEREISAEMLRIATLLGGQDPLFLTMYAEAGESGSRATFGQPEDRILGLEDVFTFSFEVVGPGGYWTELSRMVTFAPPSPATAQVADAVAAGIRAAERALIPGTAYADVQREVIAAVESHGARSEYWSGHGMGLDVLEEPWVGLDVVQDSSGAGAVSVVADGHILAIHPTLWMSEHSAMGYMSDSFVIAGGHAKKLSRHRTGLHQLG